MTKQWDWSDVYDACVLMASECNRLWPDDVDMSPSGNGQATATYVAHMPRPQDGECDIIIGYAVNGGSHGHPVMNLRWEDARIALATFKKMRPHITLQDFVAALRLAGVRCKIRV